MSKKTEKKLPRYNVGFCIRHKIQKQPFIDIYICSEKIQKVKFQAFISLQSFTTDVFLFSKIL